MDLKDSLLRISENISRMKGSLQTEEATKNAFIMPMLTALGYDVFNPFEVVPEMDCDLTQKKGDKIDYAIMKDGKPIILVECKHCNQNLDLHSTQLQKYFVASNARFAILTNGIEYRFYTDLEKPNIMDEKPFLIINMLELSDTDIEQIKKFHKSYYNETSILSTAQEFQITFQLKELIKSNINSPSSEFVRYFVKACNDGYYNQKQVELYTPMVKKSLASVINDILSERPNIAMKNEEQQQPQNSKINEQKIDPDSKNNIITTQEEIDAYNIIRSILRDTIDVKLIGYKDLKSYFVVYYKSQWSWICRLRLTPYSKKLYLPSESGYGDASKIQEVKLSSIDDLFSLSEALHNGLLTAKTSKDNYDSKH